MERIEASVPLLEPPTWATLQRQLLAALDASVYPFLEKYTRPDGTLVWRDRLPGRDGADDFYESFGNWPLLYLLGGGDHLLRLAERQWEAVTRQLTALGFLVEEYERGYDQFHQSESYTYFYSLCLAHPRRRAHAARARRFAGLYLNEDPRAPNYDPVRRLIRAPHNGSAGPRWGFTDGEPVYPWRPGMARYGLPYQDVPGVTSVDDLKDPELAGRMGAAMQARMGKGDVVANLGVTSLVTNAYLLTGAEKYRRWVLEYVDAWVDRARQNGGLVPDNVGLSGQVGEYLDGKWYGGLYGWTYPHGFYSVGMAALVAAADALLLTGDEGYLDLPRAVIDHVLSLGRVAGVDDAPMSLREHWVGQLTDLGDAREAFLVPYRHGDRGWFDFQPMSPIYPAAVWNLSHGDADWARLERLRRLDRYDWRRVSAFRTKEDAGHEPPWLCFLTGERPAYPEEALRASLALVSWRLDQVRADQADLTGVHIHHWQEHNPVTTETLVQLTLGAPQPLYNGGLLFAPVRYFDAQRRRPGLPEGVAALVSRVQAGRVVLQLVNLDPVRRRELVVQAGAFGEHAFGDVRYDALSTPSAYPGPGGQYAPPAPAAEARTATVGGRHLGVSLPPGTRVTLELATTRFVNRPTYAAPWDGA